MVCFTHVSPQKPCTDLSSPSYVLHVQAISFFLIWSPEQYWVRSTELNFDPHTLIFYKIVQCLPTSQTQDSFAFVCIYNIILNSVDSVRFIMQADSLAESLITGMKHDSRNSCLEFLYKSNKIESCWAVKVSTNLGLVSRLGSHRVESSTIPYAFMASTGRTIVSTVAMSRSKTVRSQDRTLNSCRLLLCKTLQKFWKFHFRGIGERKFVFLSLRVWVTPFYLDNWESKRLRNISIVYQSARRHITKDPD